MTSAPPPAAELAAFRKEASTWLASVFPPREADDWADFLRPRSHEERVAEAAEGRLLQARLFEAGYAGLTWPAEFGGQGRPVAYEVAFRDASEPFDTSALHPLRVGIGQCGPTILEYGTPEQKTAYIAPLLRGEHIWCQLFSEPDAGSDVANIQTRAVPSGDGFVVNGQKIWTSGAELSDFGLIVARTEEGTERHQGLSMLIIDMRSPGITIRPIQQMTGASNFCEVFFEDVVVPADRLLGERGSGWAAAMFMLTSERRSIGQRRAFHDQMDTFLRFARGTSPGEPVRGKVVDAMVLAQVARLLSLRAQLAEQSPTPLPNAGSLVKLALNRATKAMAGAAVARIGQGAIAWDDEDPHEMWRLLLMSSPGSSIAAGSDEIQRNIISERALGLPKG